MDDILIHAPTKKQLHKTTKEVLKILQEYDLYLKPEKCQFAKQRFSYLGYIISPDQVQMDLIKLKGISNWPTPSTIKENSLDFAISTGNSSKITPKLLYQLINW